MSDDLLRKNRQLKTLAQLSALVNSTLDTREIRKRAIEAATALADAETGSLLLVDPVTGDLFFEVALGEKGDALRAMRLARGQGIAGWVVESGEPLIVRDAATDPRFFSGADERSTFTTKNMVCVPLKTKEKVIGALQAINKRDGVFDEQDREGLSALANQVAIAVENANLYQELKEAFYGTAHALAETIEKRDPYTGGHTQRVMEYSLAIGKRMGLSAEETEDLKLAAILHDIGKIGIRDNILLKNGRLDKDEVQTMNLHAEYGSEILRHVKQLSRVVPGVRAHHERYDGNGYPDGLKGADIPVIARIIAVADTFDAMTTDRPYRKALSVSDAVGELRKYSGTQFDGEIVEAFVSYVSGTGRYAT
jgi:HD-GYP domain-containing protein (c-di-GMP phosphodiesterase class II)